MRRPIYTIFFSCLLLLSASSALAQISKLPQNAPDLYEWRENKGQWDANIYFRCKQHALDLQLGSDFLSYYFFDEAQLDRLHTHGPVQAMPLPSDSMLNMYALTFKFLNAHKSSPILNAPKPHYYNYYLGNNQANFATRVRASNNIGLKQLYPGINVLVHSNKNELKMEYWLEPKARIQDIKIQVNGASKIYLEYGDLFIETPKGLIKEQKPYSYQIINGKKVEIQVQYVVNGNEISFLGDETYNANYPLVIDPEIIFLTYSGSITKG